MIEITSVYRTLKSLANEDQSGFVTPSTFNDFAVTAQMNVYNEIMSSGTFANQLVKSNVDLEGGASAKSRSASNRSYFIKTQTMVQGGLDQGKLQLPDDFSSLVDLSSSSIGENGFDLNVGEIKRVVMMYDMDKYALMLNSYSMPSSSGFNLPFHIAFMEGEYIRVPDAAALTNNFIVRYYRTPGAYSYEGYQVNSTPAIGYFTDSYGEIQIDSSTCRNFDLPASYVSEVVNEMAKLIGIQIEETMVYQYGQQEEVSKETPKVN